jgi:hypothetical protein
MTRTTFFRLLKTPIDAKGETLAAQIAELNAAGQAQETFTLDPADFSLIPGSPVAYWVGDSIRRMFADLPPFEAEGRAARVGDHPGDHERYVRLFWEVPAHERSKTRQWIPYQKGGAFSPYYYDIHLVADWDLERETYYDFHGRPGRSSEHPSNYQFFFRSGLTYPRRTTSGISIRALPVGCIFADKGPSAFVPDDDWEELLALLAVMNSALFEALIKLQLGAATAAARSYEVGVIQRTPVPSLTDDGSLKLGNLALEAHDLQRDRDRSDETTHAFCLPALVSHRATENTENSLELCALRASVADTAAQARLAAIQAEIDDLVFDLYGLSAADRALVRAEMGAEQQAASSEQQDTEHAPRTMDDDGEDQEPTPPEDLPARVQNLLMWCVGVAFGRWDARLALDPTLLPALQGPFEPLPRCAPGALVGTAGLPPATAADIAPEAWLRARQTVLDLPTIDDLRFTIDEPGSLPIENRKSKIVNRPIAWDGILVDDPTHPSDIVTRVRGVLALLWGDRADTIEREACEILGFKTLRDYFRDPRKGFFPFHIKRYSKSRRKAPLYWLLQSQWRSYALWLYCHRLDRASLYAAGRYYTDAKLKLEQIRLEELKQGLTALEGSARKRREAEIERQEKLVAEVADFRKLLDAVALLNLPPDLNDGVVIGIAPLWELVPWKEAQKTWDKLVAGEYAWSTMAQQMRKRGLVR